MKIRCPNCGNRGETRLDSDAFDARGMYEGKPVRKCRQCGAGVFVLPPRRVKLIDPQLWHRIEAAWAAQSADAPEWDSEESEKPFYREGEQSAVSTQTSSEPVAADSASSRRKVKEEEA